MHLRSTLMAATATLAVVLASAGPASAHEEITPPTFPTGRATFLTLTVANESSVDLVRVALRAPSGVPFAEATRSPAGWTAAVTDETVTWTGGAVKPHTFESFGFEIGAVDQPRTLSYRVTLGYPGGRSDEHEVEVTATAPGTAGAASPTTSSTSAPSGTAPPDSTSAETTATTSSAAGASEGGSDGDSGMATAALVLSLAALVLAVAALLAGRRRGGGPAPNGASGGSAGSGAPQDW